MTDLYGLLKDIVDGKYVSGRDMADAMLEAGVDTTDSPPVTPLDEETLLGLQWILDYLNSNIPEGAGTPKKAVEWMADQVIRGWQALKKGDE